MPDGGPWPAGVRFGQEGLTVDGLPAEWLAERFGTPLVVVDEADFRARCRAFRAVFPRVLYAVKAFTAHGVIRMALEEGLGVLVSTGGELEAALLAGADPADVVFHGNNKSDQELRLAAEAGIGLVSADNAEELERLGSVAREAGRRQPVLLRVVPDVEADTHPFILTGTRDSKFGTPIAGGMALEAIKWASADEGLDFRGLHAHLGSQILSAEPFLAEVDVLLDLLREARDTLGVAAPVLNLGGGFGVVYTDEAPPDPADLGPRLLERVREAARARELPVPNVMVETGRALAANAALTLYRVGSVKRTPGGPTFVAVDGGMSDNVRPALYGASYTVAPAGPARKGETGRVIVVGKHCESGDVLARDVALPADVRRGDLLAFAATGAYTYSMASNYNRVGRPAVVAVRDHAARLIVRREDTTDLERLEVATPQDPVVHPPEGVVVRPARPSDARSFLDMWKAVVAERRFVRTEHVRHRAWRYRRTFRRSWTPRQAWIVAVAGERVVGNVSISKEEHPVNSHVATLGMAVAAEWRGRGVGSVLMAESLRWAAENGVEKLALSVYPGNRAAIALYRKFGFVEEGRLVGHSKKSYGYEDEVVMARWMT
jgi:diaminopimelate decarboxylase